MLIGYSPKQDDQGKILAVSAKHHFPNSASGNEFDTGSCINLVVITACQRKPNILQQDTSHQHLVQLLDTPYFLKKAFSPLAHSYKVVAAITSATIESPGDRLSPLAGFEYRI